MTTVLTSQQNKFANLVYTRWTNVKKAKEKGTKSSFKSLPNFAKISVTNTGVYTDSYPVSILSSVERVCRISAQTLIDLVLWDRVNMKHDWKKSIVIRDNFVCLNSTTLNIFFKILNRFNTNKMECACCKLPVKYAYVERLIEKRKFKSVENTCSISFYGVKPNGVEQRMTVDHVIPTAGGGKNVVTNMQILCSECNALKASVPDDSFMHAQEILKTIKGNKNDNRIHDTIC